MRLRRALQVSAVGLALIVGFEGTRLLPYYDSVGVPTVCTGHTRYVRMGERKTLGECEVLLREDTTEAGLAVSRLIEADMTQDQYDALVSFTFNCGQGALARSTLRRKFNSGDCHGAADEFLRWDKAGGKTLRGLTKRRKAESDLFRKGCYADQNSLRGDGPVAHRGPYAVPVG